MKVKGVMFDQEHFQNIFPEADIDARVTMYTAGSEDDLLSGNPDYVLDAIDNIETKVSLCTEVGMPCW